MEVVAAATDVFEAVLAVIVLGEGKALETSKTLLLESVKGREEALVFSFC